MRKPHLIVSAIGVTGEKFDFPVFERPGRFVADLGGRFGGWTAVWAKNIFELQHRVSKLLLTGGQ